MNLLSRLAEDLRSARTAPADPAATLAKFMAEHGVPGLGAAVISDGRTEEVGYFGSTRTEGRPVSAETLFQAASISKLVAALVVLRLVDAGLVDLDAEVGLALKGRLTNGKGGDGAVTLRRLLNHSAGTTVHGFPGYAAGAPVPTLAQILDGCGPCNTPPVEVDRTPGTAARYSGGGYVVVQKIVEDATGRSFADVAEDLVLTPLAMADSTFAQPLPTARGVEAAVPHDAAGQPLPEGAHVYPEVAAAGLWTTPADLARLALGIQQAVTGQANEILSQALARQMLEPGPGAWALGPVVAGDGPRRGFGHNGANAGFRSWLWMHLDGSGLVVMTNGDGGQPIAEALFWAGARAGYWLS